MEFELAGVVHALMVLVVDPSCIPSHLNVFGIMRLWKIEEFPLQESSKCGLTRDFSQYFGIKDTVLAQQFYTTARHYIRSIVIGVGNGKTDRTADSLYLAPLFPASIRHRSRDRLCEMVLHFGSALVGRPVLMDVELGKLVPQYLKRSEQLKY